MTFVELLDENGIPHLEGEGHHHARPGWVQIDCPFCGRGTHKYHMGYHIAGGYLNCWRCGPKGLVEVLKSLLHVSASEAKRLAAAVSSSRGPAEFTREERETGTLVLPKGVCPMSRAHRAYLRERGLSPKKIEQLWHVQGIGVASRLAWRLFIPIHLEGQVVSWTTRAISDTASLRYVSASAKEERVSHKRLLYGADYCSHCCVCVEGPFDVWRIGPGAVATLGTGFSTAQVAALARFSFRCVCFDSEPQAQERAAELVDLLRVLPGETFNVVLDAKDPGSASTREIGRLRSFAKL